MSGLNCHRLHFLFLFIICKCCKFTVLFLYVAVRAKSLLWKDIRFLSFQIKITPKHVRDDVAQFLSEMLLLKCPTCLMAANNSGQSSTNVNLYCTTDISAALMEELHTKSHKCVNTGVEGALLTCTVAREPTLSWNQVYNPENKMVSTSETLLPHLHRGGGSESNAPAEQLQC